MTTSDIVEHKQVIFAEIPKALPVPGQHIKVVQTKIEISGNDLQEGDVLLKNLLVSLDPYLRGRMRAANIHSYVSAFELGKPMLNGTVSEVLKSKNSDFSKGAIVYSMADFEEYSVVRKDHIKKRGMRVIKEARRNMDKVPLSHYLGVLGMPGQTAYVGLNKIGKPKKGETLFVSAASGAVGQVVGQLGKKYGMKVVGIASSDEKVAHLEELGFDVAINYKKSDLNEALIAHCPEGVNVNFENVGGAILDTLLVHMADFGRIPLCGYIAEYNGEDVHLIKNLSNVLTKRLDLQGFIVSELLDRDTEEKFFREMTQWVQDGSIKYKVDLTRGGLEKVPETFLKLFSGKNHGKVVVEIANL